MGIHRRVGATDIHGTHKGAEHVHALGKIHHHRSPVAAQLQHGAGNGQASRPIRAIGQRFVLILHGHAVFKAPRCRIQHTYRCIH